ncbi:MAG: type II toxin-antitoxin system VapC family toxin [Anaerolineales bacterium]|nr:type II toxin-antitoxin system VapC family toxin [Anaerolineales bacterium]MBX3036353.1 type II toxin-antitoxin system VapC family toxin [Anaerolineales bacterium]
MAPTRMILCDTNIFIEFYRNNEDVINELQNIGVASLSVSAISIGELYFGARDRRELLKIKKHLSALNQIPIDVETSETTLYLLETYALSHRLSLPDAMIAATALRHNFSLYTLNVKDFHFIEGLALHKT